jgi:hypothetical protein
MNAEQMALIAGIVQDIENMSLRLMELVRQATVEEETDWRPLPIIMSQGFPAMTPFFGTLCQIKVETPQLLNTQ